MMQLLENTNLIDPGVSKNDVDDFIFLHSRDNDNRLSQNEFVSAIEGTVFDVVLEEALSYRSPQKATKNSIEEDLKILFPLKNSTIGKMELNNLLNYLDTNNDAEVSIEELSSWF